MTRQPHDTSAKGPPQFLQCHEHGGWFRVEREAILTHADGSQHRYAVAVCHVGGRQRHEIAEYIRRAA